MIVVLGASYILLATCSELQVIKQEEKILAYVYCFIFGRIVVD